MDEPTLHDLQLQAMIHHIAWDRMIGSLEHGDLKGTPKNERVIKLFAHGMQGFAAAQLPWEDPAHQDLYREAVKHIEEIALKANLEAGKFK